MGEQLTGEDFNSLFRYFTDTAFRLEVQPVYAVTDERESIEEFLAGEPRPVTEFPFYAAWLDQIRAVTSQGRRVERVRVLEEPPTDYQRWEMWSGQYNIDAGETIRYISRSRAIEAGLPVRDDWWLFDSQRLALMRFAPDGEPLGGEIISDSETVARHQAWWDLAVQHSVSAVEYRTAP
ncbi:hypothetical protein GCM10022251_79660 [Phytohabitans flavus]|uniref:DUF6879 domain-containing protein n=1 Tax=Phytohabitans flavus TaxID=1076124 RepID=A0A6F8Y4E7_9ACTN|nr:DUF6879 family protein [Phytohabitans flavus]BCB80903.1 hypothetical protein Pflav_073130 [Phytohabitans flavus]